MNKLIVLVVFVVLSVVLTSCGVLPQLGSKFGLGQNDTTIQFTMPGVNPEQDKPAENDRVAGFGTGLWHGLVALITLFVSFFNPAIQMYEVHNNGSLYNLGFLLGTILLFGVLGFMGGRRR